MHARQFNLNPIVSNQLWYNLADRVAEFAIIPACRDQRVSIIAWGVYAQGFLTGRYKRGDTGPSRGSRTEQNKPGESSSWNRLAVDRVWDTQDVMAHIADRHGKSIPNVAVAWMLQHGACDVALVGASSVEQFADSLRAMDLRLSREEMQELVEVSELPHPYPMNFWDAFCYHDSEFYGGVR
jgi:aryl-alcohol dehydrogenase-like predicted oxidoreductase